MNIVAEMQMGFPPIGLGVFARDSVPDGPWSHVAINVARGDAAQLAALAKARGKDVWIYMTFEQFTPATWREGLALLVARAASLGATGIIVDAEEGWAGQDAEAALLGAAMRVAAQDTRVGFTSIPSFGPLAAVARAAGESVFGMPQIYGRTSVDPAAFRAWWARWQSEFGVRLIPAIAGWVSSPALSNAPGFAQYLSILPNAPGAFVWLGEGGIPPHVLAGLQGYNPGGSIPGTWFRALEAWIARPAGLVTAGIVLVTLCVIAAATYRSA